MTEEATHILLAEDNAGDADLIREKLAEVASSPFRLTHVEQLGEALERIGSQRFAAVLLDLSLPDSHGLHTVARMHAAAPDLPIVVLTALDDEEVAVRALREGAEEYLVKGQIDGRLLVRTLRYAIERKRAAEQLRASLSEKELLLQEIHHRVKNNLQVISSLLFLQSTTTSDTKTLEILQENQRRVTAIALIHEKLYRSTDLGPVDFSEYVRDLIADLFRAYNVNQASVRLTTKIDQVSLEIDTAIPCGLIINELITNTFKHGFPAGRAGSVHVELAPQGDGEFLLIVRDDGVGLPENFDWRKSKSLGLKLVRDLTRQLDGQVEVNRANGTTVTIAFREIKQKERGERYAAPENLDRR